jgi:hypothetical protein
VTEALPIDSIRIGARHRKDMGNIVALARCIRDLGLLHRIVRRERGQIKAGG